MAFEFSPGDEFRITYSDGHREVVEFEGVGHRDSGDQFIKSDGSLIHVGGLRTISHPDGPIFVVKGMRVTDIREATEEEIESFIQEHIDGGPFHEEALDITLFNVLPDEDDDDADILAAASDAGNPVTELVTEPEGESVPIPGPNTATEVVLSDEERAALEEAGLGEPGVEMPTTFDQLPDNVVEAIINGHTDDAEASSEEAPAAE